MADPSGSRRSFLNPKNLGKVVSTVTGGEWPSPPLAGEGVGGSGGSKGEEEGWLYRVGRPAMASQFEILFEVIDADLMPVAESAIQLIDTLEAQLTVYRDSSEICAINREAFDHEIEVEAGLFSLLLECREIWEETGGASDIAIHSLLEAWGLFRPPRRVPTEDEIQRALVRSGMDGVRLTPHPSAVTPHPPAPSPTGEGGRIRFLREGIGLNLASVGKGYALECLAKHLLKGRMENFLLYGGGSSLLARGSSTWEDGWLAGITTPLDKTNPIAQLRLENKALSTSAIDADMIRGSITPHVLDPRTGHPMVTDLVSATVITGSASRAEGLSTAFLVMGLDNVLEYCEKHPDAGAVLQRWSHKDSKIELIHTGIPKHLLEVLS
jgi:FAD:protein FMN transferase